MLRNLAIVFLGTSEEEAITGISEDEAWIFLTKVTFDMIYQ